jgi:hypothetical protein
MKDLTSSGAIKLKGALFALLAVTSAILLLLDHPTLKTAALLCLTIWSFCRLYYFAFYVIERYMDSNYRFSGLLSFLAYLFRKAPHNEDLSAPD